MRPFWRPAGTGNGRIWVAGKVDSGSPDVELVEWRVNGSDWITGAEDIVEGSEFGFYVFGDAPSAWGTYTLGSNGSSGWTRPTGTYYVAPVEKEPFFVLNDGLRMTRAADVASLTGSFNGWFWDNGALYVRLIGDAPLGTIQSLHEPVFTPGPSYRIEVRATDIVTGVATLVDETFQWFFDPQDNVTRFLNIMLPSWMKDSSFGQALFRAYGRLTADMMTMYEDISAQFNPATATWGIDFWEEMLGIPVRPVSSLTLRREFINAHRTLTASKTEFYDLIQSVAGSIEITDVYEDYIVDVILGVGADPQLAAAIEHLIEDKKPVGIEVNIIYGARFRAGISEAGDTL
jgi:hypothetical protein